MPRFNVRAMSLALVTGANRGTGRRASQIDFDVWAARLGPDGPTGGFFRDGQPVPW